MIEYYSSAKSCVFEFVSGRAHIRRLAAWKQRQFSAVSVKHPIEDIHCVFTSKLCNYYNRTR